ncbi:glutamate-cysteine ligase family protein [Arsenicicoccus sp. oral taxon 190]|uniref:glutamate-cysteine ligase family protein n=1 Tax=Arsenicicoccus sp. oral taxon 190 TaxID=1658671 RepID=UPI00067A0327|nr:glutamate-cysteine ligase family protein [Arsenicicoccus sp. oral taxon 190]AKT51854.1 glutamate--cysteine ligase [Arsenicicoccus sp. oral taxon 190]
MGQEITAGLNARELRQRYREKVRQCLDVLERMLSHRDFETSAPMAGLEVEMNLVDADQRPSMTNDVVLEAIDDPVFQTELARFNIELNLEPQPLAGDRLHVLEETLRKHVGAARQKTGDTDIVLVGILPTLLKEHLDRDSLTPSPRYLALDEAIMEARGEDLILDIEGRSGERIATFVDTIAPESACTSVQCHLQVAPRDFAAFWNAAQAIAGVQLAVGANSPYLFGQQLWAETRIQLFHQATDTRPIELRNQGVRPRVWFGERWVTSIFDLFEENVRYFPALLPEVSDEDPVQVLETGEAPALSELKLHNGTVYRWNRPIYDTVDGRPHLRVENRVLPAGPTVADTIANAAFYYGLVNALVSEERPLWSKMSFTAAKENFFAGARRGFNANLYWPGRGDVPVDELVLRHLLPLADSGLEGWGVSAKVRDRYLGIIEERCKAERNGASWQVACVDRLQERGANRDEALRRMLYRYIELMHEGEPVHTWTLPR